MYSHWTNTLNGSINNVLLEDGRATAINVSSIRPVGNGTATINIMIILLTCMVCWGTGVDKEAHVTIENLNEVFTFRL